MQPAIKLSHKCLAPVSHERFTQKVLENIKCCLCNNFPVDAVECDKCADLFCSRCLDLY